jgi:2,4-didehydro-3-deoxy-L-rhamnonate hydrolase
MKLVRYGAIGQEKPGLIDQSGQLRDLSDHVKDLNGQAYAPASPARLAGLDAAKHPAVSGGPRIGAPVTGISKFVAIGLNYIDHAKETGNPIPAEPIFFLKANTALSGPNDPVEKPRGSCPGHPRLTAAPARKTWMAGTNPAMTETKVSP